MEWDALFLSRLQFAFTIAFHIIFPSFTIGLASWLAVLEALWLKTGRTVYKSLYLFWSKIFALSFGLGVVSGIVMSYQFGTNWSRLSDAGGNILGPLLSYEVLTAFFLEAGFLGIMLFGWNKVGRKMHFAATLMVATGTLVSTFWILAANSWMQTPAGFDLRDGIFYPADWFEIIFNPSFPYRFAHMVLAAYLTTAFAVAGVGAWHLACGRHGKAAKITLVMALGAAAILAPLQITAGDLSGLNTLEHQPAKVAAMEGHWETKQGAPMVLFGWPDEDEERNRFEIAIPKLASLILTHQWDGEVRGLKSWPPEERPPVAIVFWAFRIMVAIGIAMLIVSWWGVYLLWRGRIGSSPIFLTCCRWMAPSGFIAVLAGWTTTEVGRQPYVVYGLVRTADAVSPISAASVGASLTAFIIAYAVIFSAGVFYIIKTLRQGPAGEDDADYGPRHHDVFHPATAKTRGA